MYVLSLDQGTTGTTAMLINSKTLDIVGKVNEEFPQILPSPGLVEHNLNDIWNSVDSTVTRLIKKLNISTSSIECIGITNQRETTCVFDKTGKALANAIVWQDRRTKSICDQLRNNEDQIKQLTGLPLDPYFSGTKIKWLIENNSKVKENLQEENLLFGNIDTFLLYKLTDGDSHKTDVTNASRTLLMNLETLSWDNELLNILNVPRAILPEICDSSSHFGKTKGLSFLPDGIPITGILGDQQAALFGQAGFDKGDSKCTYGTGAFILTNTGSEIKHSSHGLLTTVAYKNKDIVSYALEGSSYIAGAAVQWLRDNLELFKEAQDIEELAKGIQNLESVREIFFLPFFTGIASPYWLSDAKAAIVGLSRDSGKNEIARAALEGVALSINDLLSSMELDLGTSINELRVDGGAVVNDLLMNIQASLSSITIIRPQVIETTALGAALAALIGLERLTLHDIKKTWKLNKRFSPSSEDKKYYDYKRDQWKLLIKRLYL